MLERVDYIVLQCDCQSVSRKFTSKYQNPQTPVGITARDDKPHTHTYINDPVNNYKIIKFRWTKKM